MKNICQSQKVQKIKITNYINNNKFQHKLLTKPLVKRHIWENICITNIISFELISILSDFLCYLGICTLTSRPASSTMKMFIMSHRVRIDDILISMWWKSYGTLYPEYVTYTLFHYKRARRTGIRNMTAFFIESRYCPLHWDPLHNKFL